RELGVELEALVYGDELELKGQIPREIGDQGVDEPRTALRARTDHHGCGLAAAGAARRSHAHQSIPERPPELEQLGGGSEERPEEIDRVAPVHVLDQGPS